jgi:hypothetical protein
LRVPSFQSSNLYAQRLAARLSTFCWGTRRVASRQPVPDAFLGIGCIIPVYFRDAV